MLRARNRCPTGALAVVLGWLACALPLQASGERPPNLLFILEARLEHFFAEYADPRYDLWRGGGANGSVDRPEIFRRLYGEDWSPTAVSKPAFTEE